ncbi:hypothetical protein EDD21DRAFT_160083 [Dissophora ornata]|nr:hypothetical protein EDD21DRAFT_160083 [Dissophora ornata]
MNPIGASVISDNEEEVFVKDEDMDDPLDVPRRPHNPGNQQTNTSGGHQQPLPGHSESSTSNSNNCRHQRTSSNGPYSRYNQEHQHAFSSHPEASHNNSSVGLNIFRHQGAPSSYSNVSSPFSHNLGYQHNPWGYSTPACNGSPSLPQNPGRSNNHFDHPESSNGDSTLDSNFHRNPFVASPPSSLSLARNKRPSADQAQLRRVFGRARTFNGLPSLNDNLSVAPYPLPQRSPSIARSASGSVRSMSTARPSSVGDPVSPIPPPHAIEAFYTWPLGYLPPIDVCMAAGRHGLARIPIQIATNVDNIKSIHRHFFSGATYEDHNKFGLVAPDDGNNPSSFWFCRVPDCNHREKKGGSTRQRLGHLRVNHFGYGHGIGPISTAPRRAPRGSP